MTTHNTPMDTSLAVLAASTPLWLSYLHDGAQALLILGGLVLLCLRIALAWREWRTGRRQHQEE